MNPKDKMTPEERLLNLIRRPAKKTSKQKPKEQIAASQENKSSKHVSSLIIPKIPAFKEKKFIFTGIKLVNFVLINRLILLTVFIALALLSFDLFFHSPNFSKSIISSTAKPKTISLKEKEIKPYSYYQQEISKRNLFKSGPLESKVKKVIPAGSTFKELMKGLELLGIVSGDNPQVIIEDKKLHKTYFLYTGDYLGEIKVEEVYSNRVILEFKGERISLFL